MFLNPVMLACIGGAVVPLVLHLLSRARYVDVEWGAMMFLHGAQARQRYSARAAQYFLLLLRMGTVSLLALALARPLTRKATAGAVEGQRLTAALLLDCSGSMAYEENGRPRFQMAQAAARQILRGLEPGDRVSLILMGVNQSDSDLEPTADLRAVEARINEAHVVEGRADLRESLNKAADVLERYERSARDMYVVCDRQALSWNQVNASVADDWQKRFYGSADERSASSSARARMFVLPVGNEEADNVCIQAVRLLSGPAINYRQSDGLPAPVDVEVTVRNYGNIPRINLPLSISIDGAPPSRTRTVNLATNQAASVVFPIRFDRAGSHVLTAKVAVARYTGDDHFDLAVDVIDPIRVLVISGDEQSDVMRGSGELISLALAPHVAAGQQGADPFVTVRRA